MNNLKKYLGNYPNAKILDIATGQGSFMAIINEVYNGYSEMTGIDSNEKAKKVVEANFDDPRIKIRIMNANNLDFEDGYFDIVCLSNSIHHMDDIDAVIKEMCRVTKDTGILIFNEMRADNLTEKMETHKYLHHFWAKIDRLKGVVHRETMKQSEIVQLLSTNEDIELVELWEMEYNEKQEIDEDSLEWLKKTVDSSLGRAEGHEDYNEYKATAEELKDRIDEIGFESATQIVAVAAKK